MLRSVGIEILLFSVAFDVLSSREDVSRTSDGTSACNLSDKSEIKLFTFANESSPVAAPTFFMMPEMREAS